jgi:hypothetical protein
MATPRAQFGAITYTLGGGLGHRNGSLGNRGDSSIAAIRQTRLDRIGSSPATTPLDRCPTTTLDQLERFGAIRESRRVEAPKWACHRAQTTQPRRDETAASETTAVWLVAVSVGRPALR